MTLYFTIVHSGFATPNLYCSETLLSSLFSCYLVSCRVVSREAGQSVANSWKAAFLESSARENTVSIFFHMLGIRLAKYVHSTWNPTGYCKFHRANCVVKEFILGGGWSR